MEAWETNGAAVDENDTAVGEKRTVPMRSLLEKA
jgi:hypothetical protein